MPSLFLGGFMGTGKTSVGPRAAALLGRPFVDTDAEVEREAGKSVAEIWRLEGESGFRTRERAVVERCLEGPESVVALGGGALVSRELRHRVLDRAVVVTLVARPEEILRRIDRPAERPNLAPDPERRVRELLELRREVYAECHAQLSTDGLDADEVAEAVCAVLTRNPLVVPLGTRTYPVELVHDAPEALTDAVARVAPSSLVVVSDASVRRLRGQLLDRSLSHLAVPRIDVTLHPGEEHKTISSVQTVWDAALGARVDRDALVLGFGGGVVTDLAGLAASTLLRGVGFMAVPTTLVGMVDAAIGGKTAVDHPAGKNLVGTIHQPRAVVVDSAHLATLPLREWRAGLAEIVKAAVVADAPLMARLESMQATLRDKTISKEVLPLVRDAVAVKARIVRDDERDRGKRMLLNLGHTVGHALEAYGGFRKHLHGEAVAIGLCAELEVLSARGLTPRDLVDRVRALLEGVGLVTRMSEDERRGVRHFFGSDKKRRGRGIACAVVTGMGVADVRDLPLDTFA